MLMKLEPQGYVIDMDTFTRPFFTKLESGKEVPTCFLTVKDVCELTGWSIPTVRNLFHQKNFPSVYCGKAMVVEIHAFIQYFSIPRTAYCA